MFNSKLYVYQRVLTFIDPTFWDPLGSMAIFIASLMVLVSVSLKEIPSAGPYDPMAPRRNATVRFFKGGSCAESRQTMRGAFDFFFGEKGHGSPSSPWFMIFIIYNLKNILKLWLVDVSKWNENKFWVNPKLVDGCNHIENMKVNGKDYPIYL